MQGSTFIVCPLFRAWLYHHLIGVSSITARAPESARRLRDEGGSPGSFCALIHAKPPAGPEQERGQERPTMPPRGAAFRLNFGRSAGPQGAQLFTRRSLLPAHAVESYSHQLVRENPACKGKKYLLEKTIVTASSGVKKKSDFVPSLELGSARR
jgi:hypothetical protein